MEKSLFGENKASKSQYAQNLDLAFKRFPELCLLSYETHQKWHFSERKDFLIAKADGLTLGDCYPKVQKWAGDLQIQSAEIIYIYGLGLGYACFAFQSWLEKSADHHLVFIEEDLSIIKAFLHTSLARYVLENLQVHIFSLKQDRILDKLPRLFSSERIQILALPYSFQTNRNTFYEVKEALVCRTAVSIGTLLDQDFFHILFQNFLKNASLFPESFCVNELKNRFSKIPAIVCGAGASIEKQMKQLKLLQNKALIIAGGSAIAALSSKGIVPHIGVIVDPNPSEMDRLQACFAFEMPIFFSTRVFADVFCSFNGPLGYMRASIGKSLEAWIELKLDRQGDNIGEKMSENAFSVITVCISLADYLGCDPVFLAGVDLAYTYKKKYAAGVVQDSQTLSDNSQELLQKKNQQGKIVDTNSKWIMESKTISDFAKQSKSQFVNLSRQGLGFHAIEEMTMEKATRLFCTQEYDLSNWLHSEMQNCFKFAKKKDILSHLQSFQKSIQKVIQLTEKIIEELLDKKDFFSKQNRFFQTSQMVLAEMDLKEEEAFIYLFKMVKIPGSFEKQGNWEDEWENEKNKWESFLKRALFYLRQMGYFPIN